MNWELKHTRSNGNRHYEMVNKHNQLAQIFELERDRVQWIVYQDLGETEIATGYCKDMANAMRQATMKLNE